MQNVTFSHKRFLQIPTKKKTHCTYRLEDNVHPTLHPHAPKKQEKQGKTPWKKSEKGYIDGHAQEQGRLMRTMLKRLQESCRAKLVKSRRRRRPKLRAKETKLWTLFFLLYSFLPRLRSCAAVAGSIFGSVMSV
jgi:hypothetical protein